MSFEVNDLTTDPIQRVRLTTGDISDFPILEDGIYEYQIFLTDTEDEAALECLDNIINFITLNPTQVALGDTTSIVYDLKAFENRRDALVKRINSDSTGNDKVPVIIQTDRKDWNDFNFFQYEK